MDQVAALLTFATGSAAGLLFVVAVVGAIFHRFRSGS